MSGTCPSCKSAVLSLKLAAIPINANGVTWKGLSYQCPSCNTVLGAQIDPVALNAELLSDIRETFRRG